MTQIRKTPYTSVSITPEAAEALRWLAVHVSAYVGRRVSQSEAILVAKELSFRHDLSIEDAANKVMTHDS